MLLPVETKMPIKDIRLNRTFNEAIYKNRPKKSTFFGFNFRKTEKTYLHFGKGNYLTFFFCEEKARNPDKNGYLKIEKIGN